MHIEDAAERAGNAIEAAAARTLARELLDQQLDVIARSEHGVILQMIQRYRAIDAGDTAIVERLKGISAKLSTSLGAPSALA